jgi:hypothetical protein
MKSMKTKFIVLLFFCIIIILTIFVVRDVNDNVTMKGVINDAYLSNYPYGFFSRNESWPLDVVNIPNHYIDTEITINAVVTKKDSLTILSNVYINGEKFMTAEEWYYSQSSGIDPFDSLGD